jgi:hypothetical protein
MARAGLIQGGPTSALGAPASSSPNMLVPQAYDLAWTDLTQIFDPEVSPGTAAAMAAAGIAQIAPVTAGLALPANPARVCLMIQNNSATGGPVLWFNFGQQAVAGVGGSFALQPGSALVIAQPEACPKEAIYTVWAGSGTALGALYQSTLPSMKTPVSSEQSWQNNLGAQAWGFAPTPSPAPPPAASRAATFAPFPMT